MVRTCDRCAHGVRAKRYLNDKPLIVCADGNVVQCRRFPEYSEHDLHDWCGEYTDPSREAGKDGE